jgi:hypothetical protein
VKNCGDFQWYRATKVYLGTYIRQTVHSFFFLNKAVNLACAQVGMHACTHTHTHTLTYTGTCIHIFTLRERKSINLTFNLLCSYIYHFRFQRFINDAMMHKTDIMIYNWWLVIFD